MCVEFPLLKVIPSFDADMQEVQGKKTNYAKAAGT